MARGPPTRSQTSALSRHSGFNSSQPTAITRRGKRISSRDGAILRRSRSTTMQNVFISRQYISRRRRHKPRSRRHIGTLSRTRQQCRVTVQSCGNRSQGDDATPGRDGAARIGRVVLTLGRTNISLGRGLTSLEWKVAALARVSQSLLAPVLSRVATFSFDDASFSRRSAVSSSQAP